MASIIFSPKDIYEQDFRTSMRGYDKNEVDEFLDSVIKDYETYAAQIAALRKENEKLKADAKKATSQPAAPVAPSYGSDGVRTASVASAQASNIDLLRRVSRLEKEVFGKQLAD
ncbi:cell division regulator GpsB [Streptococcus dentapri]|uniref:Cell cycle protein GpsB n=1 Tax=Streptococcus dentapri TaxID=573564 RepID=A0ABV8CYW8_9STRE